MFQISPFVTRNPRIILIARRFLIWSFYERTFLRCLIITAFRNYNKVNRAWILSKYWMSDILISVALKMHKPVFLVVLLGQFLTEVAFFRVSTLLTVLKTYKHNISNRYNRILLANRRIHYVPIHFQGFHSSSDWEGGRDCCSLWNHKLICSHSSNVLEWTVYELFLYFSYFAQP